MTDTLHIHVGTTTERTDLDERFGALDAGKEVTPRPARLSIESLETFGRLFRPVNLELLEAIAIHDPASIRDLARLVDRHPPEVTENVNELADYGLVELETDGKSKRPTIWYDEIEFSGEVPLRTSTAGSDANIAP